MHEMVAMVAGPASGRTAVPVESGDVDVVAAVEVGFALLPG
jgi:hypothetical protein